MTLLGGRSAAAVLVASIVMTGCGGNGGEASSTGTTPSDPSPAASTPATSSPTTSSSAHSLADLARRPCLTFSREDKVKLAVVIDGSEETNPDGSKRCEWFTRDGVVSFTPYPSIDQTTDPELQHLTRKRIAGHRALLGTEERHGGCFMYVAVGSNQSFKLIGTPVDESGPSPADCARSTTFAKTIIAHLR